MQEQMICPNHPGYRVVSESGVFRCLRCAANPITLKELWERWERKNPPSFDKLMASVDEAIMKFVWSEKNGTLVNLFLYFSSERKPLNPREFLDFWDSLSEAEEDYYMGASAEELGNEAKGE